MDNFCTIVGELKLISTNYVYPKRMYSKKSPFQQVLCQSPKGPVFISSRTRTQSPNLLSAALSIESNILGSAWLQANQVTNCILQRQRRRRREANVKQPVAHDNEFICSLFSLDIGHLATTFLGQSSPENTF